MISNDFKDIVANLELSITNSITTLKNELKYEAINMKEVVIKRLQEENEPLKVQCSKLEDKLSAFQSFTNNLDQYGISNNIILSRIPDNVTINHLENTVTEILANTDVNVTNNDMKACHRIFRVKEKSCSKTIVHCDNRKYAKKIFV